jgi:hypothetical protein
MNERSTRAGRAFMKVRLEVHLLGSDGGRTLTRDVEIPAPPSAGLVIVGDRWRVEVDRVSLLLERGEYHATCQPATVENGAIADLVRAFEIDGWRVVAANR